jgi:hypothetical protein
MNNLFIFSSVGSSFSDEYKNSVYESWQLDQHDSGCVIYNKEDRFDYAEYFDTSICHSGFKFPNFFYFLDYFPDILDNYNYFAIIDDDLLFNNSDVFNQCCLIGSKNNLDVVSISNDNKKKKSSYHIMRYDSDEPTLWITNFCEMGFMMIKKDFLTKIIQRYCEIDCKVQDYGFDWFISHLAIEYNKKIGIIKHLSYSNPVNQKRSIAWYKKDDSTPKELRYIKPIIYEKCII